MGLQCVARHYPHLETRALRVHQTRLRLEEGCSLMSACIQQPFNSMYLSIAVTKLNLLESPFFPT